MYLSPLDVSLRLGSYALYSHSKDSFVGDQVSLMPCWACIVIFWLRRRSLIMIVGHARWLLYRSVSGKRSTITPYFSLPWALIMCQIIHKTSRWSQSTIVIAMAIRSRSPLASATVSHFRQGSCYMEASDTKFVNLMPRFSGLLADRVNARSSVTP